MKTVDEELDYFREKFKSYSKLLSKDLISRQEYVDGIINKFFHVENKESYLEFFPVIPEENFHDFVTFMEKVKEGDFQWVVGVVGPGHDPIVFRQFTRKLYDKLNKYNADTKDKINSNEQ